jgi:hypothetical protein
MTSNDDLFQLATLAADVETKSASIQAALAAAAADEERLTMALGVAEADNDAKTVKTTETALTETRSRKERLQAALAVLLGRKQATAAQLRAAELAAANQRLADLEGAARDELVTALAITDQWLAQFAKMAAITTEAELLAATWRNDLVPAPHFSTTVGGAPPWFGEFNRWRNDWAGELDRWLATAPQ